jgi:hypothetical protein
MADTDRMKALEMRIVELENKLKTLQTPMAIESISDEEFGTFQKVGTALGWIYFCTTECRPILICRPLSAAALAKVARFTEIALKQEM